MSKSRDIPTILEDLEKAKSNYEEAEQEESAARSRTTSCVNALNKVQKELDVAYKALKSSAPRSSDWGYERHRVSTEQIEKNIEMFAPNTARKAR